jgi:hypothetical protein
MYPVDNEHMRLTFIRSGIFGYVNYLVEQDRKYILDTLVNGEDPVPFQGNGSIRWYPG